MYKVNSRQIYLLWRNFALSTLVFVGMVLFTKFMPPIFAPVISTASCVILYAMMYHNKYSTTETCIVVPYTVFHIILNYTIILILLNLLNIWCILPLPSVLIFFEGHFISGLIFAPVAVVTSAVIYLRRHKLSICRECQLHNSPSVERGRTGIIFSHESEIQIRNIFFFFLALSIIFWTYYLLRFSDVSITARDSFVFTWVTLILLLCDVMFFGMRYYNLYLDLKEHDELVSPADIENYTTRTYLRFYVISGDSIYLTRKNNDDFRDNDNTSIFDTPFVIRRIVNGISEPEIRKIIEKSTGIPGGGLKFFYGRKVADVGNHRIFRYFYFLPGEPKDYPALSKKGEWMSSEKFKTIYNTHPLSMSTSLLTDMSRLATILVTSKTYDENGDRRNKLMLYRPSFNFEEIKHCGLDFQNELWIRVSMHNSDQRFFRLRRWIHQGFGKQKKSPFNNTRV